MSVNPVHAKIRKQVEFYFSDSNLPYDKYLWTLHQSNEGWIPISTIANFKKMKMISEDFDTFVAALKESECKLIEVNEENQVRRKTKVEEQDHTSRSIYAKKFEIEKPSEDNIADLLNLQDAIQEFFEQYGTVLSVRMRKEQKPKGEFKGSVFVEFSSPEEAEKVAAMDLEYQGKKLELLTKKAYVEKKAEEYKGKPKPAYKKHNFNAFRANHNEHRGKRKEPFKHNDKKSNDDKKTGEKRELENDDDEKKD
ncbi:unnamed protein product [Cunninghamella blakesleeana]